MKLIKALSWSDVSAARIALFQPPLKFILSSGSYGHLQLNKVRIFRTYSSESGQVNPVIKRVYNVYEDFFGLSELKIAQDKVITAEKQFLMAQQIRRQKQQDLHHIQASLKTTQAEIHKLSRADEKYLHYLTEEHRLFKEENSLTKELQLQEEQERFAFSVLSAAFRESHEKERLRAERTKYWGIIGSVLGALFGSIGALLSFSIRSRQLEVLERDVHGRPNDLLVVGGIDGWLSSYLKRINDMVVMHNDQLKAILLGEPARDYEAAISAQAMPLDEQIQHSAYGLICSQLLSNSQEEGQLIETILNSLISIRQTSKMTVGATSHSLLTTLPLKSARSLLGLEIKSYIDNTEHNLERQVKLQSLVTVALVYGAFAVIVPLVYYLLAD